MKFMQQVMVTLQPENKIIEVLGTKTVSQLLAKLNLKKGTALVIRDNTLLTPDLHLNHNDEIIVRKVMSSG